MVTIVTGATGFAGSHLVDRLAADGRVIGWRRSPGAARSSPLSVEWQTVDVLDAAGVATAIRNTKPDVIYHLAGAPQVDTSWRDVVPHLTMNALGTHHLLRAIQRWRPQARVLIVTSAQIYQPGEDPIAEDAPLVPPSPYGVSKLAQDQLAMHAAEADGLDVVVARPFNHTGPRQDAAFALPGFARQVAEIEAGIAPPVIHVGNLDARRDLTDVRDVVAAYVRIVEAAPRGRAYNVCSGHAWRIGDLLEALRRRARVRFDVEVDPSRFRPNDVPMLQGDGTRIRTELSWSPQIPIEQTIADTLAGWRREVTARG